MIVYEAEGLLELCRRLIDRNIIPKGDCEEIKRVMIRLSKLIKEEKAKGE